MFNSYIEKNLSKDEHVLVTEKTSRWCYVPWSCLSGFLAFFTLISWINVKNDPEASYGIFWVIVFTWYAIWNYFRYMCLEMVVTNKRAILKKGIFIHDTNELRLEKIESVNIKKSFLGLIFGYGNIVFTGTGGKYVKFEAISQPQKIKNDIDEIFEKYTK